LFAAADMRPPAIALARLRWVYWPGRSVDISEIIECVQRGLMAIVLVDKRFLPTSSTIARLIQQHVNIGYVGADGACSSIRLTR
jgi:hypothetical protein